jgi:hypothetical protein
VLDGEKTFLDIDVGGAVLAHGSQFHDVTIRRQFPDGKQQIEGADDICDLGKDGVLVVDHRIGRGALLGEVHDGFGLECGDEGREKVVVSHVADKQVDRLAGQLLPHREPLRERSYRCKRLYAKLKIPKSAGEVIDNGNRMPFSRKIQSCGPTAVPITTQNSNFHSVSATWTWLNSNYAWANK